MRSDPFQATPRAHAAAVVAALIPNIASWATGQMDNVLAAAGTSAAEVGDEALANAGVVYHGLLVLGQGAILAGLVLGAVVAFIIDKRFVHAAVFAASGAVLSFIGLIHAEKVEWNANGQVALGYLFLAVVCAIFALGRPAPRVPSADEIELDRLHGGATPAGGDTVPSQRDGSAADALPTPRQDKATPRQDKATPRQDKAAPVG